MTKQCRQPDNELMAAYGTWTRTLIWTLNNLNKFPTSRIIYCYCVDLADVTKQLDFPLWRTVNRLRLAFLALTLQTALNHTERTLRCEHHCIFALFCFPFSSFDIWFLFIYFRTFVMLWTIDFRLCCENFIDTHRWNTIFLQHKPKYCCFTLINNSQNYICA